MPLIRDYFGDRAIELAGIIVDPSFQQKGIGTEVVREFVSGHPVDHLAAYTRNPSILRLLGAVANQGDVLLQLSSPLPHVTHHDGIAYHLDRYGPNGLYGTFDPAERQYNGQVLNERCSLLSDPNHALAISVTLNEEQTNE